MDRRFIRSSKLPRFEKSVIIPIEPEIENDELGGFVVRATMNPNADLHNPHEKDCEQVDTGFGFEREVGLGPGSIRVERDTLFLSWMATTNRDDLGAAAIKLALDEARGHGFGTARYHATHSTEIKALERLNALGVVDCALYRNMPFGGGYEFEPHTKSEEFEYSACLIEPRQAINFLDWIHSYKKPKVTGYTDTLIKF